MKRICVFFIMLLCMTNVVFASDILNAEVEYSSETMTISGAAYGADSTVSVIVMNPGKRIDDIETDINSVQNFRKVKTDADGKFSYSFKIHSPEKNTGWMTYYVKEGDSEYIDNKIYFASTTVIKDIVDKVIQSGIGNKTEDDVFINVFELKDYEPYVLCDKDALAKRTNDAIATLQRVDLETDRQNIISLIKQNCLVEAYNGKFNINFLTDNGELLWKQYYNIDKFDLENNTSVGVVFDTILNETGKRKVVTALLGQSFADISELQKVLAEKTLLYSLTNATDMGYEHIGKILNTSNSKFLGVNTAHISNTGLQRAIATSTSDFEDKAQLLKFVENYGIATSPGGGSGGGSISSNGGSTGKYGATAFENKQETTVDSHEDEVKFTDIGNVEWAHQAIKELYKRNIINGKGETEFDPEGYITREEFAKIIVKAFHLEYSKNDMPFADVDNAEWYAPYVLAAYEAGIIKGVSDNEFGTGADLSRQDICTIVCRALNIEEIAQETTFVDKKDIADYAIDAVNYLVSVDIVKGFEDGTFLPHEPCTRAQASKIVYEVLCLMEGK